MSDHLIKFSPEIFTQQAFGGVGRYFTDLAIDLVYLKQKINISAPIFRYREAVEIPMSSPRILHPKLNFKGAGRALTKVAGLDEARKAILGSATNPSVYHWTNYSARKSRLNCPEVLTVYDMIHEDYPHFFKETSYSLAKSTRIKKADALIAISNYTAQRLTHYFPEASSKIRVIHLGVRSVHPRQKPLTSEPFILYLGTRNKHKNFPTALKAYAMSKLPSAGIRLVAFGGGHFKSEESALIDKLGITGLVFAESGSRSDVEGLLGNAFGLIYPSIAEGFGLPPLEAMSFGCPVVASDSSSIPEVVGESALLFDPYDFEEAASHLDALLQDDLWLSLSLRGLSRAADFTTIRCAEQTLDLYRELW